MQRVLVTAVIFVLGSFTAVPHATAKAPTSDRRLPYARWVPSPLSPLRQLDELRTAFPHPTPNCTPTILTSVFLSAPNLSARSATRYAHRSSIAHHRINQSTIASRSPLTRLGLSLTTDTIRRLARYPTPWALSACSRSLLVLDFASFLGLVENESCSCPPPRRCRRPRRPHRASPLRWSRRALRGSRRGCPFRRSARRRGGPTQPRDVVIYNAALAATRNVRLRRALDNQLSTTSARVLARGP